MKYSVKWVEDNLGVTRKSLRNYEAKGLMSKNSTRNPKNNYREYDEEDLYRIWSIKLLQGIGYSVKEILDIIENPEFDFYTSISNKVIELEKKRDEFTQYVEFAKSIKLTGRVPTTKQVGSIKYGDFIRYARENWNFYSVPETARMLNAADQVVSKPAGDLTIDDLVELEEFMKSFDYDGMAKACNINAHYKLLTELRSMEYSCEVVQTVVKMLYDYICEQNAETELAGKITPQFFAKNTVSSFLDGDIAVIHKREYGKEGCLFIANAIAFFGRYDSIYDI